MDWLHVDTNIWSELLRRASRPDRRDFVQLARDRGLRLGWTVDLLREVGRTRDGQSRREIAETIVELSGDEGLILPNHFNFARELCDALGRDHPDLVHGPLEREERYCLKHYRSLLWGLAGGSAVVQPSTEEQAVIVQDSSMHARLRGGSYNPRPYRTLIGQPSSEVLRYMRASLAGTLPAVGAFPTQRSPPIHISAMDFEVRVKLELLRAIVEVIDTAPPEDDARNFVTRRLAPTCTAEVFANWVWTKLRPEDVPAFRIAVAVSLGQTLHAFRPSNLADRDHSEVLGQARLFLTADRKLAEVLGHRKLRQWIPQRWRHVSLGTKGFRDLIGALA